MSLHWHTITPSPQLYIPWIWTKVLVCIHCYSVIQPSSTDLKILGSTYSSFPRLTTTISFYCLHVCAKLLRSCPTLCNTMDCSPPGFSVHRILQTRMLEWVAVPSSRGSSWWIEPPSLTPTSYTLTPYISYTLTSLTPALAGGFFTTRHHLGSPTVSIVFLFPNVK